MRFENSSSLFIAERSSMNQLVEWYLYALINFLEIKFYACLDLKKNRETRLPSKEQGQYP